MLAGLIEAENAHLTNGTGTLPAILGLLNQSGIQVRARDSAGGERNLDALFRAINDLRTSVFAEPTALVMHPNNFTTARLSKADGSGECLTGDPMSPEPARLWGSPSP
jgi:HK97 family phage major capsid protein